MQNTLLQKIGKQLEEWLPEGTIIKMEGTKALEIITEQEVVVVNVPCELLQFLTGRSEDVWRPVCVEKITYIESNQKKTWFYAGDESYRATQTLKELMPRLPQQFLQVHRSYIVNIHSIVEISKDIGAGYLVTMEDGAVLPVSQSFVSAVRKRLEF